MSSHSSTQLPGRASPDLYRPRQCASVWQAPPTRWVELLVEALESGIGAHTPQVFFRADDIGAGGRAFETLCALFRFHEVPLNLAVVPAWLSEVRRDQLFRAAPLDEPLWSWHQHGWRHVNWQRTGKKCEFGEQRPYEKQWRDISQGQQKMRDIFGSYFVPVFTPPWNRLSFLTLRILQDLQFKGVSLWGPFPRGHKPPIALKNLRIQIDLHTRKAAEGEADYRALLEELKTFLAKRDPVGVMIHHQRMNLLAFQFLHELLSLLKNRFGAQFLSFRTMLGEKAGTEKAVSADSKETEGNGL